MKQNEQEYTDNQLIEACRDMLLHMVNNLNILIDFREKIAAAENLEQLNALSLEHKKAIRELSEVGQAMSFAERAS